MTTDQSTQWLIRRLERASSMDQLRKVWNDMADGYQRVPIIIITKNKCKEKLK